MRFFLGTHHPHWLRLTTAPLFVCDRRLRDYRTLPQAQGVWSLDSGGFTELQKYGSWEGSPPREYAERVRRYQAEVGNLAWAAPQDWMCEPIIINGGVAGGQRFVGTHLSVAEHQRRTVTNFLELRRFAPEVPWIPVLQGFTLAEYLTCVDRYHDAGVDLAGEPTVGIGSVCRRQSTTEAADIISAICEAVPGIQLHGFGIKTAGLGSYGTLLASSDSLAWSYDARRNPPLPGCEVRHKNCANCPKWAFRWREKVLTSLARHITATPHKPRQQGAKVSRKLDSREARLRLSAFRDEAGRLERDTTIRQIHRDGLSVRDIAAIVGLSPARVGQITAEPEPPEGLLEQLRALRQRWEVDEDPATRAAADQIIAHLAAADDAIGPATAEQLTQLSRNGETPGITDTPLFDVA